MTDLDRHRVRELMAAGLGWEDIVSELRIAPRQWEEVRRTVLSEAESLRQRIGEDMLDWMHRLAENGATARTIAKRLDLDLDDVIYWMERNGYIEH